MTLNQRVEDWIVKVWMIMYKMVWVNESDFYYIDCLSDNVDVYVRNNIMMQYVEQIRMANNKNSTTSNTNSL